MTGGSATRSADQGEKQSGASIRRGGRNFMVAFYAALRAIKLYPLEHRAVQKTLAELFPIRVSEFVGNLHRTFLEPTPSEKHLNQMNCKPIENLFINDQIN